MLKYNTELASIAKLGHPCPPVHATSKNIIAYRWVFSQITSQCFLPQAVKQPKRVLQEQDLRKKCSLWALSMHSDVQNSKKAFETLLKSWPKARKTHGDAIAEINIQPMDGECTSVSLSGHFDLHLYDSSSLANRCKIVLGL